MGGGLQAYEEVCALTESAPESALQTDAGKQVVSRHPFAQVSVLLPDRNVGYDMLDDVRTY